MVTGQVPYSGLNNDFKIWKEAQASGPLAYAEKINDQVLSQILASNKSLQEFLINCLKLDYKTRPSSDELLQSTFLK